MPPDVCPLEPVDPVVKPHWRRHRRRPVSSPPSPSPPPSAPTPGGKPGGKKPGGELIVTINPTHLSAATTPAPERATRRPGAGQLDPVGAPQDGAGGAAVCWRRGNPLGNLGLDLAPRRGARARSARPCRAPVMADGRCRRHGGRHRARDTRGVGTDAGAVRMGAVRMVAVRMGAARHAWVPDAAPKREKRLYVRKLVTRMRMFACAMRLGACLPVEMAARPLRAPVALLPPEMPAEVVVSTKVRRTPSNCLPRRVLAAADLAPAPAPTPAWRLSSSWAAARLSRSRRLRDRSDRRHGAGGYPSREYPPRPGRASTPVPGHPVGGRLRKCVRGIAQWHGDEDRLVAAQPGRGRRYSPRCA